ncbi:MAG: HNH endonuclease [Gemmatimonadales bacterium]|nr:HNH endonuclease [Gemmatimonadales bacterium]
MFDEDEGFVLLGPGIREHRHWPKRRPFTRGEALTDLMLEGCLVTSQAALGDRWRWARSKVRKFLSSIDTHGEARVSTEGGATRIEAVPMDEWPERAWLLPRRRRSSDTLTPKERERRKLTNGLRYKILRRDGFRCVLCGATAEDDKLAVDHIIPVARDGKTTPDNLRTLCKRCNSGKGTKLDTETGC